MIARYITHNGETLGLLVAQPNRAQDPEVALEFPDDIGRHPISKIESRRTFARSARYTIAYRTTLRTAEEITELRIFLNKLREQTIALPLWLDVVRLTSNANAGSVTLAVSDHPVRSGGEWIIGNEDFSEYEIVDVTSVGASSLNIGGSGTEFTWPKDTLMYPLVFGHLADRPEIEASTPARGTCDLKLKESSPYARRLNQYTIALPTVGGNVPNLSALPRWPIHPSWINLVDLTEADVSWSTTGFGREETTVSYDNQPVRRGLEMEFRCRSRRDIAAVETFFADRRGRVSRFCIPTFRNDLELAANAAPGDTTLTIAASEYSDASRVTFQGDPYIALVEPIDPFTAHIDQASTVECHKVMTVTGTTLTLETATSVFYAHDKTKTRISHLLLVRLVDAQLVWKYSKRYGTATARLKFIELPNEYTAPSPNLKEPAFLYLFEERTPYLPTWRFTSYEDAITIPSGAYAGTYEPAPFSHGSLRRSLKLDEQKLTLKTSSFSGSPLARFFPFALEGPLILTVLEANATDLTEAPRVRFNGEVIEPNPQITEATCKPFGRLFDRKLPNFILSTTDNFSLFQAALGLNAADWRVNAAITVISSTEIHLDLGGDKATDWFANGWIETGTGDEYESRAISASVSLGGSALRITIDHPFLHAIVGQAVAMYPGYDGTIDELETKFGDRINHGGHPFVPDTPPNVKGVKAKTTTGGKK